MGKYVAKFLRHGSNNYSVLPPALTATSPINSFPDITPEFLGENGFIWESLLKGKQLRQNGRNNWLVKSHLSIYFG